MQREVLMVKRKDWGRLDYSKHRLLYVIINSFYIIETVR